MVSAWPGLLGGLGLLFLIWFLAGTQWNVRRGERLLRWLQPALPQLAERTTLRWLGSSAVELHMAQAHAPFRQLTLVILLEPRDVPGWWLLSRWGGRRDLILLRARLRRPPEAELEVADPASWSGRRALRALDHPAWREAGRLASGQLLLHSGRTDPQLAPRLMAQLEALTPRVVRLAVRRQPPHLELHLALPPTGRLPATTFVEALRQLARQVSEHR